ncbi:MAG: histidine phosphatase family protein [Anaerolineae bacterium]|nr:histidine phosphatase family protein [Anaerolineae bacterium]
MTHFIFIRHGETDWNLEGRWQGQSDVPLNTTGITQAAKIASRLKNRKIDAIYSSDLIRARHTAESIGQAIGQRVYLDVRLREINQGDWQGLLIAEIEGRYTDALQKRRSDPLSFAPPGGETAQQVRDRAVEAIYEISRLYPAGTVLVVAHGFIIAVLLTHFKGLPFEQVWSQIPKNCVPKKLDIYVP